MSKVAPLVIKLMNARRTKVIGADKNVHSYPHLFITKYHVRTDSNQNRKDFIRKTLIKYLGKFSVNIMALCLKHMLNAYFPLLTFGVSVINTIDKPSL